MADLPHAVLSEHLQERMRGRRLRSAVFLTYQFDPGFFEQEILPVLLDIPLSHAVPIRLVQLEDALRGLAGEVAVYYDANGLSGDSDSARLDVRRIPVQHRTGIFHAKNMLLLVESVEGDDEGHHAQTLIVASLSANLTRAGWWENVESCHVEEISEGDRTRLKDEVKSFLESLRRRAPASYQHRAVNEILAFLRTVFSRSKRSAAGQLYTHFFAGTESLIDFLDHTAGNLLRGACLEIISPYFDDAISCKPLENLIARFQPKEVRVFLPRSAAGEGLCRPELYDAVRALPEVEWGRMDRDFLRLGSSDDAGDRFVHAKIYRFFTPSPKREICFVGSANLTSSAHQSGGNMESGFLVDFIPPRRPDFWLGAYHKRPVEFQVRTEDEAAAASGGTHLNLRYHWDKSTAEAFWDAPGDSPELRLEARGMEVGGMQPLASRVWNELPADITLRIKEFLPETSLFKVDGEGSIPGYLLVQEEGMSHKPSLLMQLSAADILRYWSLLTAEQRSAFIDAHAPELALLGQGADLVTRVRIGLGPDTLFDRFAGFFHAFGCLERAIRSALDAKQEKEVNYRLFGRKYDSLDSLLDRVEGDRGSSDDVDQYVIVSCARQLCRELAGDYPTYWGNHVTDAEKLGTRVLESFTSIRKRLIERNPDDMAAFLDWFDRWFLLRADPAVEVEK